MKTEWQDFKCINESNLEALQNVKEEKDITNEDILLILQTLRIKRQPVLCEPILVREPYSNELKTVYLPVAYGHPEVRIDELLDKIVRK